jgi:acylphosphatase
MLKHYNVRVYGTVQKVHFRRHAAQKAEDLDIYGFIMNKPDGSVYMEIEGEEEALDELVDWCWEGSERANVDDVKVKESDFKDFIEFEIRH